MHKTTEIIRLKLTTKQKKVTLKMHVCIKISAGGHSYHNEQFQL